MISQPLVQGKDFLVGRPTSEEHLAIQPVETLYSQVKGGAKKVLPFAKNYIDKLP